VKSVPKRSFEAIDEIPTAATSLLLRAPGAVAEPLQERGSLRGQLEVVLAGLLHPQVGQVEFADIDTAVLAVGQAVEQVAAVEVEPLQVRVAVGHDLGEEAVLADVVLQIDAELLRSLHIVLVIAAE